MIDRWVIILKSDLISNKQLNSGASLVNRQDTGSTIVFFNKFFICHFLQVCVVWRFIVTCDGNVKPVIFSGLPWLVGCKKIIKIEGLRTRLKLLRRSSFNQSDSNSSSTSVVKPATVSPGKVSLGMIFPKFEPKHTISRFFLKMYHFMSSLVTWDVVILILIILKTHVWLRDF